MDNISVAIRVRPLVERELLREAENHWQVNCNTIYQVENGVPVPSNPINPTTFVFDKVYSGYESTESVYNQFAKPLVFKAMEGFNGTIFAYGQTGTGKTYTMMGEATNPGVTPRTINDIFAMVQMAPDREFLIRVSYMEIYNEVITDLLKSDGSNLKIRNNERNEIFVENLCEVPISSPEDALSCLESGEQRRRFGVTNMNEKSSRSHTIFRITIESKLANADESVNEDGAVIVSQLNLVDLAGSERAAQTGAQGTRLKESGYINKSLLALGTVISKLSSAGDERAFIPYRDSKLTRILQNSLGGNAKTSVIATVSSAAGEETFSTLKFASRAKTIKNKPTVNEILDGDTMIRRYRKEINMLKRQINEINDGTKMEKMEQLLEENEQKRREQELKINGLQKLIISASEQTICWKRKASSKLARRETWCPGKQKRSLGVALLDGIIDEESEDDDVPDTAFPDSKSDFLKELDREERRSCEEFKRKRSKDIYQDPMVKFRGSFQSISTVEAKVDQSCQTETTETASSSDLCEEQDIVGDEREKVKILSDENAELKETIERLTLHLSELEAKSSPLEGKGERATSDRVGTRRRGGLTTPYLPPSAKKKRQLPTMDIDTSWSEAAIHVMSQGLRNDSLLNFEMLEKDMEIEDLHGKLKEAQDTINDLKRSKTELDQTSVKLITESPVEEISSPESSGKENQVTTVLDAKVKQLENAIEDMQYKIDEIELENMALKEKDRQNESHLELLAKENLELQRDLKTGTNDESKSEHPDAQLAALQKEKEELMRELEDERSLRRSFEDKELEKVELQKQIEDLKSLNEGLLDGISYKKTSIEEMENKAKLMEDEHSMELEELRQELVDLKAVNEDLCKKIKSREESTEEDESSRSAKEDIKNIKLNAVEIEERNVKLVKENSELLKKMEDNHAEKCLLEGELHELSLKFTQLEKLNEELQEKTDEIIGQNMEDNLTHDSEKREVENLMIRLDELEEMSRKLQEEVSVKDRLLEEASNRTNEEVEEMRLNVLELEKFNKELLESRENMMGWNVSEEKGGEADRPGVMVSGSKECSNNLEKDDGMRSSFAEDKRDSHDIELEALMLKLKELEERNNELLNEVVDKNSLLEKEDDRTQEELNALQLKLAEVEKRNEELLNEVVDKNSLLEKEDHRTQEELNALELKLAEVEKRNEELLNEVVDKNSLLEKEDNHTQEEIKALQLQLAEVEKRNEELLNEVVDKNSLLEKEDNHTQEEIKALQLQLAEVEKRNEELLNEVVDKNSLLEKEDNNTQEEIIALELKLAEVEKSNEELQAEILGKDIKLLDLQSCMKNEDIDEMKLKLRKLNDINDDFQKQLFEKDILIQRQDEEASGRLAEGEEMRLTLLKLEGINEELHAELRKLRSNNEEDSTVSLLKSEFEELKSKQEMSEGTEKEASQNIIYKMEDVKSLKDEFAEIDDAKEGDESYNGVIENLTIKIMELEEQNEALLVKIVAIDLVEKEKNELLEKLSIQSEEMHSLEDEKRQLVEKLKDLEIEKEDVMCRESFSQELKTEMFRRDEVEDMKIKLLEIETENENLRKAAADEDDVEVARNRLIELENANKQLSEELDLKCALLQEKQMAAVEHSAVKEEFEMQLVELKAKNEQLNLELVTMCELLEGQRENMKNFVQIEEAEELRSQVIELQMVNEELSQELSKKTDVIDECNDINEMNKKKIANLELVCKQLNEDGTTKSSLLVHQVEGIKGTEETLTEDQGNVEKIVRKFEDLGSQNEDFCKELHSKSTLLEEGEEEAYLDDSLVREKRELEDVLQKLVSLEELNKDLRKELDTKSFLLAEKEEEMKNCIKIKSAEELRLKFIELEETNEELRLALSQKEELIKEQGDINEILKNSAELEKSNQELREEISSKSMLLKEMEEKLKAAEVIIVCERDNAEEAVGKLRLFEERNQELHKEVVSKCDLMKELENANEELCLELNQKEELRKEIMKRITELEEANEELHEKINSKSMFLIEVEEKLRTAGTSLGCEKEKVEEAGKKLKMFEERNEELNKEIVSMCDLLKEKEEELNIARNCNLEAKWKSEAMEKKLDELELLNEDLQLEIKAKCDLIQGKDLEMERYVHIEKLEEARGMCRDLEAKNDELCEKIERGLVLIAEKEEQSKLYFRNAEECQLKLTEIVSENKELREEIARKKEMLCENRDEENMKSVVAGMEAENSELKIAMDEKETEISLLKSRVEDFQQEERRLQENALKEKESVAQQSEVFKSEIENLKVEINELKEELRVTNYEKYKYLTLEAQENSELNDKVYELNKQIEKERAAAKEKIASVKKYFSEEAKKRRGEVCIGVALEKENIKLKEKLERSEQERISYEEYQEKRVTGLKSELKKLQEMLADASNVAGNGHAKLRNVVDNAALFTLKADKANLERENGKLKGTVEDLTKKNASLAFEKYNLESKFESVKAECYKVKRSVRGETFDVQTQTESIWSRSTHRPEAVFRGQENKKREVAPFDEQFQLYVKKDEEPGQCTQQ